MPHQSHLFRERHGLINKCSRGPLEIKCAPGHWGDAFQLLHSRETIEAILDSRYKNVYLACKISRTFNQVGRMHIYLHYWIITQKRNAVANILKFYFPMFLQGLCCKTIFISFHIKCRIYRPITLLYSVMLTAFHNFLSFPITIGSNTEKWVFWWFAHLERSTPIQTS